MEQASIALDPIKTMVILFAGDFAPYGWLDCNGQLLTISSDSTLFSLLNVEHGGDGRETFALPNLPSKNGIRYIMNQDGMFPRRDDNYEIDLSHSLVGAVLPFSPGKDLTLKPYSYSMSRASKIVIPYSKTDVPQGWLPCDGRELKFASAGSAGSEYGALFSVIRNRFGGYEPSRTFNLPNLNNGTERYIICFEGEYPIKP